MFRTLFYLPYLAPPVAATLAFVFLLNPGTGPVNRSSATWACRTPGWFTDAAWSKPALTMLALWGIGDLMVIFMAALLDVPKEQYEAAELDGAGAWHRFRYVTLPNISPIIMFAVVTGVIQTMQYYTQPLVAGKVASGIIGGSGQQFEPGYPDKSTLTLPQLVYNLGFQRFDYGSACVVALVLFALSMAFTALLMRRRGGLIRQVTDPDDHNVLDKLRGVGRAPPVSPAERTARRKALLDWIAVHALGVAAALFFVLPFVFVLLTSLMSDHQALTSDLWPHTWEWGNYAKVFDTPGFLTWWRNTLLYAGCGTVLTVVSSDPGGLRARQVPLPRPEPVDDAGHLHDDAAAAGHHHPDVPVLGQAAGPVRAPCGR